MVGYMVSDRLGTVFWNKLTNPRTFPRFTISYSSAMAERPHELGVFKGVGHVVAKF